jgi:hypothetical protein
MRRNAECLKHGRYGIELRIIASVAAIDVITAAVLGSYEVSTANINAFIIGVGVRPALACYIIRFTIVRVLEKERDNNSLEHT